MGAGLLSLEQSYLIDLFMMMEMVSTCAVQCSHHQPCGHWALKMGLTSLNFKWLGAPTLHRASLKSILFFSLPYFLHLMQKFWRLNEENEHKTLGSNSLATKLSNTKRNYRRLVALWTLHDFPCVKVARLWNVLICLGLLITHAVLPKPPGQAKPNSLSLFLAIWSYDKHD